MIYVFRAGRKLMVIEADDAWLARDTLELNGYTPEGEPGEFENMGTLIIISVDADMYPVVTERR